MDQAQDTTTTCLRCMIHSRLVGASASKALHSAPAQAH